ncbi:MAG: alpha/beta fold hydrolase [Gemmatimonadota bacterium]
MRDVPPLAPSLAAPAVLLLTAAVFVGCGPGPSPEASAAAPASTPSFDGVPIVYEVHGPDGRSGAGAGEPSPAPLVLVHGWSCDRSYWEAQIGPLSAGRQVVTVDLAGHGESGMGRERWTIASYGADVAAVLEALDLRDAILVGHSMGGDVVVDAARIASERVAALVWVDDYRRLGRPSDGERIRGLVAALREDFSGTTYDLARGRFPATADSALVERVARDMAAAPPEVAIPSIVSSLQNGHLVPIVLETELDLPIATINPDDGTTDVESMRSYGVDVVLMPNVGHFMMMEDPAGFNELLLRVVDDIERVL